MSTLLKFVGIALIVCAGLLLFAQFCVEHNSVAQLSQVVLQYDWAFLIWRYAAYLLVVVCWPHFIQCMGVHQQWPEQTINYFSRQRWKLTILFLCIEVLFVYNWVGRLIGWI